jgi:hypothetical protein
MSSFLDKSGDDNDENDYNQYSNDETHIYSSKNPVLASVVAGD